MRAVRNKNQATTASKLTLVVDKDADGPTTPLVHRLAAAFCWLGEGDLTGSRVKGTPVDRVGGGGVEEELCESVAAERGDGEQAVDAEWGR